MANALYDIYQVRHHLDDFENAARAELTATQSGMARDMLAIIAEVRRLRAALKEGLNRLEACGAMTNGGRGAWDQADPARIAELRKLVGE